MVIYKHLAVTAHIRNVKQIKLQILNNSAHTLIVILRTTNQTALTKAATFQSNGYS
jgi:hypothetical protein